MEGMEGDFCGKKGAFILWYASSDVQHFEARAFSCLLLLHSELHDLSFFEQQAGSLKKEISFDDDVIQVWIASTTPLPEINIEAVIKYIKKLKRLFFIMNQR